MLVELALLAAWQPGWQAKRNAAHFSDSLANPAIPGGATTAKNEWH